MRNNVFEPMNILFVSSMKNDYINMMLQSLLAKHEDTFYHTMQTAMIASSMGTKYNRAFAETEDDLLDIEALVHGALLHDIGKMMIYPEILTDELNCIQLSKEDQKDLEEHTEYGYRAAKNHIDNEIVLDIIRHHHERMDGSGYPDHLKDKEISIYAKIVGVADYFDIILDVIQDTEDNIFLTEGMKLFDTQAQGKFDPEIVKLLENRVMVMSAMLNKIEQ